MNDLMAAKSVLQAELEEAADFNLKIEEKVYKSNMISRDLMEKL